MRRRISRSRRRNGEPASRPRPARVLPPSPLGASMSTITLSDATFQEEIASSSETIIVDFWAEWCGPCRKIAPVLDELAAEHAGKLRVAKLNVDDNPETARRFQVMSIPTLLVFQDGEPKKRLVGAKGKSQLSAELAEFL
ncbi:MAG: thioredoxin [Actinobacteria bacterium]|nr:thioredoxin [Actinomycetota bacterium]